VRLHRVVDGDCADVVVKLEFYNPTGSYKDRMALSMIEGAERRGALRPGMRVVEFTGGSTGSSLALVCSVKGYPFVALSSEAWAKEKLDTMTALGAELLLEPSEGGKITPGLVARLRERTQKLAAEPGTFWSDQFNNDDALDGYKTAVGIVPPHLKPDDHDEARALPEAEGRAMARRLAREEGIFAGTSTGLNVAAAVRLARELGPGHTVATVAVDTGLKYLAGDLYAP